MPGESFKYYRFPLGVFDTLPPSWAGSFITAQNKPDWQSENFLPGALLRGNGGLPLVELLGDAARTVPHLRVYDLGP